VTPDTPPQLALSFLKRALLASTLIILLSAGAVSAAGIITADDLLDEANREGRVAIPIPEDEIDRAEAGEAQTLMLLGTDARYGDTERARSDTIVLVRIDPDKNSIAMTTIPRDLMVDIPGHGRDKINAAYHYGGARLTLKTVKQVMSRPGKPFPINHVVEIDFGGFQRVINYIGCVYVDIDRDYFNDNSTGTNYATIDIDPGYQRLCGQDSLDYVRYRHGDNDLIRNARQQDFLRQLKAQAGVRRLLTWDARRDVARLVGRYTSRTQGLREREGVFGLLRLLVYTADQPISEVRFRSHPAEDNVNVEASDSELSATVREFQAVQASSKPRVTPKATSRDRESARIRSRRRERRPDRESAPVAGLENAAREGEDQAVLIAKRLKMPFYFPTVRTEGGAYVGKEPRVYRIRDETGKKHAAYRMVVATSSSQYFGEYYGIQGTAWRDPPILDDPSETITRNGRKLELFYDGRRLRLVAWRTKRAAYWVSNTLTQSLSEREMIAIAASLKRLR
jgi:LCP family protein required for cell wall assembly